MGATNTIVLYDAHFLRGNVQVDVNGNSFTYEWTGDTSLFQEWFNVHFFGIAKISETISDDANLEFTFESTSSSNVKIKMTTDTNGTLINRTVDGNLSFYQLNKTAMFCLTPAPPVLITIDEKGLEPIDGIYSGSISPPTPGLNLNINIQWYKLDNSTNGRVMSINNDAGLYLNEDGSRWFIDLNNLASWADKPGPNSFKADGRYVISTNHTGAIREFIVDSSANCTATILPIPAMTLPNVSSYKYSYRINGGEIITNNETAGGSPSQTVFTNILAYYGLFTGLVTNSTGHAAFKAQYGQPIKGASVTDPNVVTTGANTIEFLLTPEAQYDLIQTIFGGPITLHSCAIVNWT